MLKPCWAAVFSSFVLVLLAACAAKPVSEVRGASVPDSPMMVLPSAAPPLEIEFDLIGLLRRGQYEQLEIETTKLQGWFEAGNQSELAMRRAYRQLYNLSPPELMNLNSWVRAYPKSYTARLTRGTYYKQAGFKLRGNAPASETPPQNLQAMQSFRGVALADLEPSLTLTAKPYFSVFHMLDLEDDNPQMQRALMESATRMFPSNGLVRARYMRGLAPRWGGSYEAMWAFLSEARQSGATEVGAKELEAIIHDDMGETAIRAGNRKDATEHFRRALQLGAEVGDEVPRELPYSRYYRCTLPDLVSYCR